MDVTKTEQRRKQTALQENPVRLEFSLCVGMRAVLCLCRFDSMRFSSVSQRHQQLITKELIVLLYL